MEKIRSPPLVLGVPKTIWNVGQTLPSNALGRDGKQFLKIGNSSFVQFPYNIPDLTVYSRLDEVTSQLDAIQKTLGMRTNPAPGISVTQSVPSVAGGALSSPGPASSATPEDDPKDVAAAELTFYRASLVNDLPESPVSMGCGSLNTDEVIELFAQSVSLVLEVSQLNTFQFS